MKRYDYLMKQYPKHIIFMKEGQFYGVKKESAYLIHHLMGFKLYLSRDDFCTGCPEKTLPRVEAVLKEKEMNYVIMNQEKVEQHIVFDQNHYDDYQILFEQFEQMRKEELVKRSQQMLNKEILKKTIFLLKSLMSAQNYSTSQEIALEELKEGEVHDALGYATNILSVILEQGRFPVHKVSLLKPFAVDTEKAMQMISASPVKISEFIGTMNREIDTKQMKKLSVTSVTNWLVANGYLCETLDEQNKKSRIPTPLGESIGIMTKEQEGNNGIYHTNLYNQNAQQFLVEHLSQFNQHTIL